MPSNSASSRVIWTVAGPYSRRVGRGDVAAELERHQLGAVADAEHGQPAAPDRGVGLGGAVVVHGHRAAREDDRPDPAPLELGHRRVVGQQLRVDVELADAARDQLGELAAEVEDGDGRRAGGGRRRPAGGPGACARGPARRARPRDTPRPRRRRGRARGGRRWPARRGRSCRAAGSRPPRSRPRAAAPPPSRSTTPPHASSDGVWRV